MHGLLFCDCFCGTTIESKDGSNRLAKDPHATARMWLFTVLKWQFLGENGQKTQCFTAENAKQPFESMQKYFSRRSRCFSTSCKLVTLTC